MQELPYDKSNPANIESYAKFLVGKTFREVIRFYSISEKESDELIKTYSNARNKGGLGNLLEETYFGYKPNNNPEPDFPEAGVELKASPYEKNRNGIKAGERLVLTMIHYDRPIDLDFYASHLWKKSKLLLLIYYFRNKDLSSNLDFQIDFVKLFTPPIEDLKIIKDDYNKIINKIQSGMAHELSESDTMYLGACTKGATAEKSKVSQYYGSQIPAKKRAFCFKNSYMTYILNKYLLGNIDTYEPIISDSAILDTYSFDEYVIDKINIHKGKTDKQLCAEFNREFNKNKAQWIDLSYRMLGIKSNQAEEFIKANIVVKAIRVEANGLMKEHISLPPFKFKQLINEEWEDSTLYTYFDETKFLFVIYKRENENDDYYKLMGCQLWNMPSSDLNNIVQDGWIRIRKVLSSGITFTKKLTQSGYIINNTFPSKKINPIIHIRPHSKERAYKFSNGEIIGDIYKNANELPDGQWMTTQSFWLNNSYLLNQMKAILSKK